jgi:ParB family chromosome partitioning protein
MLNLPAAVQASVREGKLEEGHGKILASFDDRRIVMTLWRRIIRRGLSVKQTSDMAAKLLPGYVPRGTILGGPKLLGGLDPNVQDVQNRITQLLGAKTRIRPKPRGSGGVVEIHYSDWEELDRIYQRIALP